MRHAGTRAGIVLATGIMGLWGLVFLAKAADSAPKPEVKKAPENPALFLREQLETPTTFEFENGPLRDASAFLQDRYHIPIIIDTEAFKAENKPDVESTEMKMPKVAGIKLRQILRIFLDQIQGDYLEREGILWIMPHQRLEETQELVRQPVVANFKGKPLTEALAELSLATGFSVVVDGRAGDKAKTAITANLNRVPLENAVFVLADMSDLRSVLVGRILYVTTKENAEGLNPPGERTAVSERKAE